MAERNSPAPSPGPPGPRRRELRAGGGCRRCCPSRVSLARPPFPARSGGRQRCGSRPPSPRCCRGRYPREHGPGPAVWRVLGCRGSPTLLVAVGIWRRGRQWRGGRGRRWLRGRGGGGTCSASASPAPPPAARGLQTRQSSCAPSIQARKSGSLIEPAFPLTQPQPRLIRSTEGKEAN